MSALGCRYVVAWKSDGMKKGSLTLEERVLHLEPPLGIWESVSSYYNIKDESRDIFEEHASL